MFIETPFSLFMRLSRLLFGYILATVLAVPFVHPTLASEQAVLQVLTYPWRPLNYEENGEIKGSATEVVVKTLNASKLPYKMTFYPWQRTYSKGQSDPNTLIYTIIRTPEREPLFQWVRPVAPADVVYVYRLKTKPHINPTSLEDLNKFRIGVTRESMKHQFLLKSGLQEDVSVFGVNNNELIIKMLHKGRIDLIAYSENNITQIMKQNGSSVALLDRLFAMMKTEPYMALSNETPKSTLQKLQSAYDQLKQQGKISF